MRASERQSRIQEIEEIVAKLQDKGWKMEKITHIDEADDPFWTAIHMSCESSGGVKDGIL